MNRSRTRAAALCGLICVSANAEPPAWLDDWYEIEVIIFIQPDAPVQEEEGSTPNIYTEDLIVRAPQFVKNVTGAFPLTQSERALLRDRSSAVDMSGGTDPWFRTPSIELDRNEIAQSEEADTQFGTFPEWLLPPGESYEPLFFSAFEVVPFGDWFASLSLASLIDKDDHENEVNLEEELVSDEGLLEETEVAADEIEITREEILDQIKAFREELEQSSYIMDEQDVRLPRTAERMRSKGVHVIKHFNWHQYVPSLEAKPGYVFFQSLSDFPTEGIFAVSKGRFIHFDAHVWIHQPRDSSNLRFPVYELAELRRMQREDVHYLDHPRFGILAEVVKVDLPPELQTLWDTLD